MKNESKQYSNNFWRNSSAKQCSKTKKSGVAEKSRNYDKLCEKLNNATECQNASSVKKCKPESSENASSFCNECSYKYSFIRRELKKTTYAQQNSFGTNYLINGAKNNLQNAVAGAKKNASMSAKYQQLKGIFDQAQQKTGISSSLLAAIAANESGFNPNATGGSGTTVTGIFQIRPKDWSDGYKWGAKYGVSSTPSPKNNLQATLWVAGRFAKNRDSGYYQKLGISRPTDCDYYMTHFLGEGGYATLCRNLDKPAASVLPKEARYNKSIFYDKGHPRTGRQIKEFMLSKLKKRCAECGIPIPATMHM